MTIRRNVFPPDQYFFNILDKALDVYTLITNMFYWLVILMLKWHFFISTWTCKYY